MTVPATDSMTHGELKKRIASIDILRGIVMLIMLVDHVREKVFYHHPISDPMTIDDTSTSLFFTRLAAHFCAPVFVFLTGLSAWLYAHPANKTPRSASAFLFKRGLFIVFIEVTLINFSWFGNYQALYLQVMWAIGLSMIALSLLVRTNYWLIAALGVVIVFGHNALTSVQFSPNEFGYTLWTILHDRGYLISDAAIKVKISYPVLPWIGVICLGYAVGPLFARSVCPQKRVRLLWIGGVSSLLLLLVLRGFNIYGETLPWQSSPQMIDSIKSFLNFTKYPPSLNFLLMTLGTASVVLALLEKVDNRVSKGIEQFGSAPMFFYLLHLYVLMIGYRILLSIFGANQGEYFGVDHVWQLWLVSLSVAVLLYLPTRAFSALKKRSKSQLIKYF